MKIITTLILTSFLALTSFGQIATNGVYVQNGKTTEVNIKNPHPYTITTTNKSETLQFSNGLVGRIDTNSDFSVDSFSQDVLNTNNLPEKAVFGLSSLNTTLTTGTATFVYTADDTNSSCVVSTPLSMIELHKGSFYFVVNEKSVLVLVIDGSLVAYGDKKDTMKVSVGDALIAIPNTVGILDTKISLSTQFIREPTMNKLKATAKEISDLKNSTLFIRIDGKTIGVNL